MILAASSFLHPIAVAPHQRAYSRVSVLRLWPCRAIGVHPPHVGAPPETLRADLAGSARTFGLLFHRTGLCLQAVSGRVVVPCRASPMRFTGIS